MKEITNLRSTDQSKRVWVRPTLFRMDAADAENNMRGPFNDSGNMPMQNS